MLAYTAVITNMDQNVINIPLNGGTDGTVDDELRKDTDSAGNTE